MKPAALLTLLFAGFFNFLSAQCLLPSPDADTLMPVINRMSSVDVWGTTFHLSDDKDSKSGISATAISNTTAYIGGNFNYLGPNTGTGVIMDKTGSQVYTAKKWRINGPVLASVADGAGGYYIGGLFSRVGDSARYNIAHINSQGVPTAWKPVLDDGVRSMVLINDTLIIGGQFSKVNGQVRYGYALINKNTETLFPSNFMDGELHEGTVINAFKLVDSILYVGAKSNAYNDYHTFWKINIHTGTPYPLPAAYQMDVVNTIAASEDKTKIFIGGWYGGTILTNNGFCMDASNGNILYRINVGVTGQTQTSEILNITCHGNNVFVGGYFDFGDVNGNAFSQGGILVFNAITGQKKNVLTNCNGFVSSIHAEGSKVYLGGEFHTIGGQDRVNFAIYDTLTQTIVNTSQSFSDRIQTISFSGSSLFAGGYFQSVGGVAKKGFAAFDINTGQITPWTPDIFANSLAKMIVKGDTVLMCGHLAGAPTGTGALAAVNATTGIHYSTVPKLLGTAYDMLIDNDSLYVSGPSGTGNNTGFVKIMLSSFVPVVSWQPKPAFDIKTIMKANGKIYGIGDMHAYNVSKAYLTEINAATGQTLRTLDLGGSAPVYWINSAALSGNKLFFSGSFTSILAKPRLNFAVFDINSWSLNPIDLKLDGSLGEGEMIVSGSKIYLYSGSTTINNRPHPAFAVIDTTFGSVFPDRLKFNNDLPTGFTNNHDMDNDKYALLNTAVLKDDYMLVAGSFRNIDGKMFSSIAKLPLTVQGSAPMAPQGVGGSLTIQGPSQNNQYYVVNANPDHRYAWYYSGADVTIRNNGYDTITLDAGTLASPGLLKVIALGECGRSDTTSIAISINTSEPTVAASALTIRRKTDTTATIRFTRGNGVRRVVVLRAITAPGNLPVDGQDYAASDNFGSGSDLGNNSYMVFEADGDSVNVKKLQPATVYHVSVIEFNGSGAATNYLTSTVPVISFTTYATQPTIQAGNIIFSNNSTTGITINCTPGNGEKRLVVIRKGTVLTNVPADGSVYTPDNVFGAGANLGNVSYVLSYGTPVVVTGLEVFTTYTVNIFEFSGQDTNTNYLQLSPALGRFTTRTVEPTVQAGNIVVSNIASRGATINCTIGNGTRRFVVMREGNPVIDNPRDSLPFTISSVFGGGTNIGNSSYIMAANVPVNVTNLRPAKTYYVKVFEYNGSDTLTDILLPNAPETSFMTLPAPPSQQTPSVSALPLNSSSAQINAGFGTGEFRLIVIRKNSPVTDVPVDGIQYTVNPVFGSGSDLGNNSYAVRNFSGQISGLEPNTTYYVKVFEYNGTGIYTRYLIANAPSTSFTTPDASTDIYEPLVQATSVNSSAITTNSAIINCTPGDGQARMVLITKGTSLTATPADQASYIANSVYGSGADIGGPTYVVSTSTPVTITNLQPQTDYTVRVFEFNGTGNKSDYLLTNSIPHTFHTQTAEPLTATSGLVASNRNADAVTINGVAGGGQSRLIVIRQGTTAGSAPVDGTAYTGNTVFGSGSDLGNQSYVVSTTALPVTITGLSPETDYTISVFEYNGTGTQTNYLTTASTMISLRTLANEPTTQASNIVVSAITSGSATIQCTAGNGQSRLITITQGTTSSAQPVDGNGGYTANAAFGSGTDLGGQTYILSTTGGTITVTGLQPLTDYTITVFEYNGSSNTFNYLATGTPSVSFRTEVITAVVDLDLPETSLRVRSNPIRENKIDIDFKSSKRGTLYLELFTLSGTRVVSTSFPVRNNSNQFTIPLPAATVKGPLLLNCKFIGKTGSTMLLKL